LKSRWGSMTAATLYRDVAGISRTGDTQVCAFDVNNREIFVSYSEYKTAREAFYRSPIRVKLNDFWGK